MLKRAVFGLLPTRAEPSTLRPERRPHKPSSSSSKGTFRRESTLDLPFQDEHEGLSQAMGLDHHSGKSRRPDHAPKRVTLALEEDSLSDEEEPLGEEDEDEEDEFLNRDAKLALLKRAALMYSSDPRRFLAAMKKHDSDLQRRDSNGKKCKRETKKKLKGDRLVILNQKSKDRDRRCNGDISEEEQSPPSELSTSSEEEEDLALYDYSSEDGEDEIEGSRSGGGGKSQSEETNFRGKFQCKLCPEKIFIFEADLEKHLQSKRHRRREAAWEAEHAAEAEDGENSADDTAATDVDPGKEQRQVPEKHAEKRKKKEKQIKENSSKSNKKTGKDKKEEDGGEAENRKTRRAKRRKRQVAALTEEEIQKRKEKFQRKKARRMARKQQEESGDKQ
ncbi:c2h2 type zinc-finger protein [Cystoisospora suis]|uniref:C2h2 type zinc-finger protein n=1 Tax=Cystoisospora suis TaxID=483139 RepID=A0A2C6LDI3_9APIC|nr:c2h2 type zinc-finger protein [Cystoisospora suis]